jgi:hypothetical protein
MTRSSRLWAFAVDLILKETQRDPDNPDQVPTPWVSYLDLREKIAGQVPPGYALRSFNNDRERRFRERNNLPADAPVPPRIEPMSVRDQTSRGQLAVATRVLNADFFGRRGKDEDRQVRLDRVPRMRRRDLKGRPRPLSPREHDIPKMDERQYKEALEDAQYLTEQLAALTEQIDRYEAEHPKG